jgi:hypothetical protein
MAVSFRSFSKRVLMRANESTCRGYGGMMTFRHCERSEAIHPAAKKEWIASLRSQ